MRSSKVDQGIEESKINMSDLMIQKYKNITKSKKIHVIIVIPGKKEGIP